MPSQWGQRQQGQLRKVGLGVLRRQDRYSALDDRVRRGAGSRPSRVRVLHLSWAVKYWAGIER
jgi:hypothetical protein